MMIFLIVFTSPGFIGLNNHQTSGEVAYNQLPPLLITEIVPQTTGNVDGRNAYEYIEVYNNTNQTINFKDYQVIYRYPEGPSKDVFWTPEQRDIEIEAGDALVIWVKPASEEINNLTDEDFNKHYTTEDFISNLTMGEDLIDMPNSGALHNQRMREIVIRTNTGKEVVKAQYNKAEFDVFPDMGVIYKYPEDGSITMEKVSAGEKRGTPGHVSEDLVPEVPVSVNGQAVPTINDYTRGSQPLDHVEVYAEASDEFLLSTLTLNYKASEDEEYHSLNLEDREIEGVFKQVIPFQDIIGSESVDYYFEASNGMNNNTTEEKTIKIEETNNDDVPPLLITELVPDSQNLNGKNAYEFIEVYNNTSEEIDFGDYHILYRYPSGTADQVWFENLDGYTIKPGGNIVLWVDNGDNEEATNKDFLNNYGIGDEEINLVKAPAGAGMANGVERDIILATNTGEEIVSAGYNKQGANDVSKDKGIFYHFPIGSNEMIKVKAGDTATPGTVEEELVPDSLIQVNREAETVIEDQTNTSAVYPGDSLEVITSAENDFLVTSMTLYYKHSNEDSYQEVELKRDAEDRLFRHTIDIPENVEAGSIDYYFVASNGFTDTESDGSSIGILVDTTPEKPEGVTPENNAKDISINTPLQVKVPKSQEGEVDVKFYQGNTFNASQKETVKAYINNSITQEPPKELRAEGEVEYTSEEYKQLQALNGQEIVTDSVEALPYHRFEITLNDEALSEETVEAVWHGSSLAKRKVTMYAWHLQNKEWLEVDSNIPDSNASFTLNAEVSVENFVDGNVLNILVQDEIPEQSLPTANSHREYKTGDIPNFEDFDFNFVWLADTQFYTEVFPWHYENQVNWIADNKDRLNIEYVFHSGDIVNTWNQEYQWEFADEYMQVLEDADVPYGILAGNHDLELPQMDYTNYYKYFGADRFEDKPYYGGSFKNNRGHYDLISVQGIDFIMVHMGWQPQDDGIAWMNHVLEKYPDRIAILNFHQYLDETNRTPMGDRIFEEVVVPNDNVQLVIGGHHFGSNVMSSQVEGTDRIVYELMGNFQDEREGGLGFLNMMSVDIETNSLYVTSYSPSVDQDPERYGDLDPYNFYADTPYRIPLDLTLKEKLVATDYIEVNSYAGDEIGVVRDVSNGEIAEILWEELEYGHTYSWFATATNEKGEITHSDMNRFTTASYNNPPVIHAEDVIITVGDSFNPFEHVTATDEEDGDLTDKIVLTEADYNVNEAGVYTITYKVTDSGGKTTSKTITLTVLAKDTGNNKGKERDETKDKDEIVEKDQNDDGSSPSEDKGHGKKLPKTATNMYTWLLIGLLVSVAGVFMINYRRNVS